MENQEVDKDAGLDQAGGNSPSKSQLAKIKERFGKLTDQLRRTTMILKKREKSYYELEEKYASVEREVELEKEKNQRLEQQFKDSMEGTLDGEIGFLELDENNAEHVPYIEEIKKNAIEEVGYALTPKQRHQLFRRNGFGFYYLFFGKNNLIIPTQMHKCK